MLNITKAGEPRFFKTFKQKINPENREGFSKIALRTKEYILEHEQKVKESFYCVYCERKIDADKSHIEHVRPKAGHQFPHLFNDYNNLAASCNSIDTCGNKKGHDYTEEFINPIEEDPNEFVTYEISSGRIVANGVDFEERTEYTCGLLNLNDNQELLRARKNILVQLHKSGDQVLEWIDYFNEFPSLISFYKRFLL